MDLAEYRRYGPSKESEMPSAEDKVVAMISIMT